ncbi:Importin-4, putative [Pediculus humanus corporis]|uniref:Importin-4, putative n=1 Tax=Pediculus humanus subsp. corporis TaxID=121224 RepID=E0VW37_PEDHC|nr:Importin-4, putative [Pediculus humanus corporis]EEB17594.1 Importin-4, putative [Pediculus humanus corporis]
MEEILSKLLVSNNAVIIQGTKELREAFKNPEAIPALCNVLSTSNNPQIRQYAAVILRKRLSKQKHWNKLPLDVKTSIKQGILQILINEKDKSVKNSVAQFIGIIAKHEESSSSWPELLKLVQSLVTSTNTEEIELGVFTLSVLTDVALDIFSKHPEHFSAFFMNTFQSPNCLNTTFGYYTIMTMIHVVSLCESNSALQNAYNKTIPQIIQIVKYLATTDEQKACDCLELFDEISGCADSLLIPHVQAIIHMCLELASNKNLGDEIRSKAINLVGWITRVRRKSIIKHKLIKPIVDTVFALMCEPPDEDNEEEEDYFADDDDDTSPSTNAAQTLDVLALNLPPEKLITPVLEWVSKGLAGNNIHEKKASYLALAMLAEGCFECIRNKYLKEFLQCVCRGITDPTPIVRNVALFALGHFSEYLQPEISDYASELMPILLEYLSQLCNQLLKNGKPSPGIGKMFYALEMFCQNLEEKLTPYLPSLMEGLLLTLKPEYAIHIQDLAISAIGAAAAAVKLEILPFFPKIIEHLKVYLLQDHEPDTLCLQIEAIVTLSILARTLGEEHFSPLAEETMQLALKLADTEDPDVKKTTYGLFSALSCVMKDKVSPYLSKIVEMMIESLKSSSGIVPHYSEDENAVLPIYDDLSDTPDEEDIDNVSEVSSDSGADHYTVENSYVIEKEEACLALKDIAFYAGSSFLPFLEESFQEVYKLVNYPHDYIRKASIEALAQFCVNFSKIETPEGKQALNKSLSMVIPKCAELVKTDEEISVVIGVLDSLNEIVKDIKKPAVEGSHRVAIVNSIRDVLTYKTQCQDKEDEDDPDSEDAEQDELLLETAGDIVPNLGRAMSSNEFVQCMSELLPIIMEKLKKKSSVSQRSFFVGTLAECMALIGPELSYQAVHMLHVFLPLVKDEHPEVRSNAIYGLGELVFHSKDPLFPHYNEILNLLSNVLSRETFNNAIDNICGAIARLVITNTELVPMDIVFPGFLQRLPLREDFEEHSAVLKCFGHLYQLGHPILLKHLMDVIKICCSILHDKQGKEDVLAMTCEFLRMCQKDFPVEFSNVLQSVPGEVSAKISGLLTSSPK